MTAGFQSRLDEKRGSRQRLQVPNVTVDGGQNARALEIHLRLALLRLSLCKSPFGAHALRCQ